MKGKIVAITLSGWIAMAALTGCSLSDNNEQSEQQQMDSQSIKELVNDYSVGNIEGLSASITSHQLIVTDQDKNQFIYALPEDEFFVSIAPYVSQTHP